MLLFGFCQRAIKPDYSYFLDLSNFDISILTFQRKIKYNKHMRKKLFIAIILVVLFMPILTQAGQFEFDPDNRIAGTLELTTTDPEEVTVNIIRWALGALGLVAVITVLIGGFTWMTAAGNEEKISTAKKILTYAVIGLAIIIFAMTLVSTVFNTAAKIST